MLLGVRGVELNWQCQALGSYRDATASQCVYYNNYLLTGFRDYFICKRIRTVQSVWPVPPILSHGTNPNARYKQGLRGDHVRSKRLRRVQSSVGEEWVNSKVRFFGFAGFVLRVASSPRQSDPEWHEQLGDAMQELVRDWQLPRSHVHN